MSSTLFSACCCVGAFGLRQISVELYSTTEIINKREFLVAQSVFRATKYEQKWDRDRENDWKGLKQPESEKFIIELKQH